MELHDLFKQQREGKQVTIPGTDVQLDLMPVVPKKLRQLHKQCTTFDRRGAQVIDREQLHYLLLDLCVVGWKNVVMEGKELSCNGENRRILDDNWTAFSICWQETVTAEQEEMASLNEAAGKNLSAGLNSTSAQPSDT